MEGEGKAHERIVQRIVNQHLKEGAMPGEISISGSQNPGLEKWAQRKGIVFDGDQAFDILSPEL